MPSLKVSYQDPAQLRRRDRNPRTHTPRQIKQIAASIKEFGFINPVLIDGSNGIIAGHGRVEAAELLGMGDIPTVRVDHLTPAQVRAYVIADNRLAELAGWDRNLLALELQELSVQPNFDVAITGFETAEIDILIGDVSEEAPDEADVVPDIDRSRPAISQPGDLWRIGDHYLLCGNASDAESYKRLLGSAKAQLVALLFLTFVWFASQIAWRGPMTAEAPEPRNIRPGRDRVVADVPPRAALVPGE